MLVFRRLGIMLAVAAGAALTVGLAPAASADDGGGTTYNWVGNTQDPAADNHSWGDKKNWDPQEVPKDGDSVVIELPPGRCAAHVDGVPAVELKNFTMQESGASGACGVGIVRGRSDVGAWCRCALGRESRGSFHRTGHRPHAPGDADRE